MKYFNFLLENDITFKQDETGNYTALVKVFNPEYVQQKENSRNNKDKGNFNSESNRTKADSRHFRSNSVGKPNQVVIEMPNLYEKQVKKVNSNLKIFIEFFY
jgi:hypothetical protein